MVTIISTNFLVFLIVLFICIFKGLDLKKWSSWLYGLYGFISGFLVGFLTSDGGGGYHLIPSVTGSLQIGALFAFVIMYGGATSHWHRKRFAK